MSHKIKDESLAPARAEAPALKALFGMLPDDLKTLMASFGQKPYRAAQIVEALYKQRVTSIDEISVLPAALRLQLTDAGYTLGLPELVQTARSVDGTERYLVRLADGETVETVWMPDGDGGERGDGSEASAEEEAEEGLEGNASEFSASELATISQSEVVSEGTRAINGAQTTEGARAFRPVNQPPAKRGFSPGASEPRRDLRNTGALAENSYRRATICISSQVGCAVNCQFCLTAKLGIKRNLTGGEIAGQVAAVLNRHGVRMGKDRINLVFMGMGEPFLNYDQFIRSVNVLTRHIGIPESRMTVSTSGIEPAIRRFAEEPIRPKLALSLNASNDVVREQIMPITRKWKIAKLLEAVNTIPLGKREWVTFEYVMLGGINDQPQHAREVLDLLKDVRAKVNLIVWNPGPGIAYTQPRPEDVATFQKMLIDAGMPTYIRRPRGRDIYAACGQLKRTVDSPGAMPPAPLVEIQVAG